MNKLCREECWIFYILILEKPPDPVSFRHGAAACCLLERVKTGWPPTGVDGKERGIRSLWLLCSAVPEFQEVVVRVSYVVASEA